jgi:hypothetical protein
MLISELQRLMKLHEAEPTALQRAELIPSPLDLVIIDPVVIESRVQIPVPTLPTLLYYNESFMLCNTPLGRR